MFFTDRTRAIITPGTTSAIITPAKRIEIVKLLLNNMSLDSINRKCKHGFTTLDCAYTFDYLIQNNPACFHVPMPPQKETMEIFDLLHQHGATANMFDMKWKLHLLDTNLPDL